MNSNLEEILIKMCSYVNADFENIDFTANDWYWRYNWTQEQENDFIGWLADYFYTNKRARENITTVRKIKKDCLEAAKQFVNNYGWKLDKEK